FVPVAALVRPEPDARYVPVLARRRADQRGVRQADAVRQAGVEEPELGDEIELRQREERAERDLAVPLPGGVGRARQRHERERLDGRAEAGERDGLLAEADDLHRRGVRRREVETVA